MANQARQPPVEAPVPKKSYTLDVSRPECFLEAHLPGVFEETPPDSLPVAAIDGDATVHFRNGNTREGGKKVEMEIILMTGTGAQDAEFYISLVGSPATLEEAYTLARRISNVVGITDEKIVRWREQEEYKDPVGYTCFQPGTSADGRRHGIEIVHSLTLDDIKPWAINYQIYFTIPEREKLREICSQQLNDGP